jgi:hypothetical protein
LRKLTFLITDAECFVQEQKEQYTAIIAQKNCQIPTLQTICEFNIKIILFKNRVLDNKSRIAQKDLAQDLLITSQCLQDYLTT